MMCASGEAAAALGEECHQRGVSRVGGSKEFLSNLLKFTATKENSHAQIHP